jgi:polyisoprenoid-binding protein YceI
LHFSVASALRRLPIPSYGLVLSTLAAIFIFGQTAASAGTTIVDLDPSRSTVEFSLGAALHTVHGTFKLKSGHIEFSPEKKTMSGEVVVDAVSGSSGNETRDGRMKNEVLEIDRYPEIVFLPLSIEGDLSNASSSITVAGSFAIHGQKHPLSVPMQLHISGTDVVATGKFVVPYVAWGMKNPSNFLLRVDQSVSIDVSAKGSVSRLP